MSVIVVFALLLDKEFFCLLIPVVQVRYGHLLDTFSRVLVYIFKMIFFTMFSSAAIVVSQWLSSWPHCYTQDGFSHTIHTTFLQE